LLEKNAKIKNVQRINKTIKAKPFNLIVEAINNVNEINNLIFILVASSELHSNMIFESLKFEVQEEVIKESTNPELKVIINNIFPDEIFYIIESHPEYEKKILSALDSYNKRKINELMQFESDTNGSLMNTELIKLFDS
jgi:Mg/Co/Ni transporter MgtE